MLTTMNRPASLSVTDPAQIAVAVQQAASVLAAGGVVVAPTETRYGLLASTDQMQAVKIISEVKGRDVAKPVAVFVNSLKQMQNLAIVTPQARALANSFLPGPLTLVLKARVPWPEPLVCSGRIGMRYSSSPVVEALLQATGVPLTATSANLAGEPEAEDVSEIMAMFGYQVQLYLDGGRLTGPVTTVVDASGEICQILRDGAIARSAIESCLEDHGRE